MRSRSVALHGMVVFSKLYAQDVREQGHHMSNTKEEQKECEDNSASRDE